MRHGPFAEETQTRLSRIPAMTMPVDAATRRLTLVLVTTAMVEVLPRFA